MSDLQQHIDRVVEAGAIPLFSQGGFMNDEIEEYERTKHDPRNLGPWKPSAEGNDAYLGVNPDSLREHLRKAGRSKSPRKLAALAKNREKAALANRGRKRTPKKPGSALPDPARVHHDRE